MYPSRLQNRVYSRASPFPLPSAIFPLPESPPPCFFLFRPPQGLLRLDLPSHIHFTQRHTFHKLPQVGVPPANLEYPFFCQCPHFSPSLSNPPQSPLTGGCSPPRLPFPYFLPPLQLSQRQPPNFLSVPFPPNRNTTALRPPPPQPPQETDKARLTILPLVVFPDIVPVFCKRLGPFPALFHFSSKRYVDSLLPPNCALCGRELNCGWLGPLRISTAVPVIYFPLVLSLFSKGGHFPLPIHVVLAP